MDIKGLTFVHGLEKTFGKFENSFIFAQNFKP